MRSAMATNLVSKCAGHDEHRHGQRRQSLPQWPLRAGASEAQARGQSGGGVAAAIVETGVGERGEHRLGQPSLEEQCRPRRAEVDVASASSVGAATCCAKRRLEPVGGADEYQSLDELRVGEREVQAQPAAHRVADVGGRAAGARRAASAPASRSGSTDADPPWPGASTVTTSKLVGQAIGDRRPRPAGLGEAVDERRAAVRCPEIDVCSRSAHARRSARRVSTCTKTAGSWAPGIDQRLSITYVGTAVMPASLANASDSVELGDALVAGEEAAARRRRRGRRWRAMSASTSGSPTLRPSTK